jgi:ABC-type transport system involved in cytochrome c biogenesis permease subunit
MFLRIQISGRAPVTNMYETVMFSGFGALILGFIIYLYKKEIKFLYAALAHNLLCLLMMKFANNMLSPSISPLVPVLRDNFWLSTHVTTIILSYAALALSWVLANISLVQMIRGKLTKNELIYNTTIIYSAIKYGVTLLALGIILGGIWADYSWGRFWGWDPKETWSLIVLLIYIAILHGKSTSWIKPNRFVPMVAAAFMSVMMAWFGVNYILATGLHSYGFSEGGAIFLASFFVIQIIIILLSIPKTKILAIAALMVSCSHQKTKDNEPITIQTTLDLSRSSYLRGCVDSKLITKLDSPIYNECLKLAKTHEKEIKQIINQ